MNLDEDSFSKIICTYGFPITANVEGLAVGGAFRVRSPLATEAQQVYC